MSEPKKAADIAFFWTLTLPSLWLSFTKYRADDKSTSAPAISERSRFAESESVLA
jgi:hypothetical protein